MVSLPLSNTTRTTMKCPFFHLTEPLSKTFGSWKEWPNTSHGLLTHVPLSFPASFDIWGSSWCKFPRINGRKDLSGRSRYASFECSLALSTNLHQSFTRLLEPPFRRFQEVPPDAVVRTRGRPKVHPLESMVRRGNYLSPEYYHLQNQHHPKSSPHVNVRHEGSAWRWGLSGWKSGSFENSAPSMGVVLEFQKKKKERKKNTEIEKQIGESDIQVGLATFTVLCGWKWWHPPMFDWCDLDCSPCQ